MDLKNSDIVSVIKENIVLFDSFDNVYLFGSVLNEDRMSNDVDVLLVYSERIDEIAEKINRTLVSLENLLCITVDLTVLSVEEEQDTQFLSRISPRYLRIK